MRPNRHIIIGTAGHVDHGKTELVKALTGVNTDRLREEQERGISIELGFAEVQLPGGDRVGLVDVPGHERFIKSMVAGAAGMDLGILVVAGDESVMPQTREHLDIMVLLGLKGGVLVITKCDLVDDETADIVEAEIEDLVQGTFLEGAPCIRTSARTGRGLDELLAALDAITSKLPPKPTDAYFRLPVDRAFALSGVGLVVTGTAWSGQLQEGESLELHPRRQQARVRSIQVHGEKRKQAFAGERVAINLHGLKAEEVERGMLLATPGKLRSSYMLDAKLFLLPSFDRALRNRTRVRIHHGASEILGRVVLLDRDALQPGESAPVQLRLESPLAADVGDRVVLRFYSPMRTIGGARVLDARAEKHKRFRPEVLEAMQLKASGDPQKLLHDAIARAGIQGMERTALQASRIVAEAALQGVLDTLRENGQIEQIGSVCYDRDLLQRAADEVYRMAEAFQNSNPLAWGIGRAELQERLGHRGARAHFSQLLEWLAENGPEDARLFLRPDAVRAGSADRELSSADQEALTKLEALLRQAGSTPPSPAELQEELELGGRFPAFVSLLEEKGSVIRVNESLLYHRVALNEIEAKLRTFLMSHEDMRMADFKSMTGLTRKYAIPLLEYFDRLGVTTRDGDLRHPGALLRT